MEFSEKDIRFTQKGNILYATALGVPTSDIILKSFAKKKGNVKIKKIEMLGSKEKLSWNQSPDSLVIRKTKASPNDIALVFKISLE